MVRQEIKIGLYNGIKISNEMEYSLLQFVDDTIMIWGGSIATLWALKALFRGFEMVSGLKINMTKNKLFGIGMAAYDLEVSS